MSALLTLFAETDHAMSDVYVPNIKWSGLRDDEKALSRDGLTLVRKGTVSLELAPEGAAEVALLSDSAGKAQEIAIRLRGHGGGTESILQQELGPRGRARTIRHPCYDEEAPRKYVDNAFLSISMTGEATLYAESIYDEGLIIVVKDKPTAEQMECKRRLSP
ncbi:hypothetical protein [Pararhizobium polonicum]|uniref:hypothetical protein n=1 Tax=Pararhizobium polonicum TaxID=1612624 RepID=UPI001111E4FA|nr:hypothetical protein [Pararhizobium polonicum]